jgi:hypothetical protein
MARVSHDPGLLQAALYRLSVEKEKIEAKIRDLQSPTESGKKAPVAAAKPLKDGASANHERRRPARASLPRRKNAGPISTNKRPPRQGD